MQKIYLIIEMIILTILSVLPWKDSYAQSSVQWSNANNLSNSGAASQSKIVVSPKGDRQVFWWDKFDGLMTSSMNADDTWSFPSAAKIPSAKLQGLPSLFVDSAGQIYAIWIEYRPSDPGQAISKGPLMFSQVAFGGNSWSFPKKLAESASMFDVSLSASGEFFLAFINTDNLPNTPAGIYSIKKGDSRAAWSQPSIVYQSIYLRLLTSDQAHISTTISVSAATEIPLYFLEWFDPFYDSSLLTVSANGGKSWSSQKDLNNDIADLIVRRLIPGDQASIIWQADLQNGCALFQQNIQVQVTDVDLAVEIGEPEKVIEGLSGCPSGGEIFQNIDNRLFWVWGEGTGRLSITTRAAGSGKWTMPDVLGVNFDDPKADRKPGRQIDLAELQAVFSQDKLVVSGTEISAGEVWITETGISSINLQGGEISPWIEKPPLQLSQLTTDVPGIVFDNEDRTHVVWSATMDDVGPGDSLNYARFSLINTVGPVEIIPGDDETVTRQPALLADNQRDVLHLVWSGGEDGSLLYSWSSTDEASSSTSWSVPTILPSLPDASLPQIAQDASGNLYILFIVPLNEARGVYLIRSMDGGATWSNPVDVFSASSNQVPMVNMPSLAITPDGRIFSAWLNSQPPGLGGSLAIRVAVSDDSGDTWNAILDLPGSKYNWPRLVLAAGQIHLFYVSKDRLAGTGSINHAYISSHQEINENSLWNHSGAIPGWRNITLPYAVTTTGNGKPGGGLYLIAADAQAGVLHYSTWDGEHWAQIEDYVKVNVIKTNIAVGAVANPAGGSLSIVWLGQPVENKPDETNQDDSNETMYLISRAIPTFVQSDLLPMPATTTPEPTTAPTQPPKPTVLPSPTPNLNTIEDTASPTFPPMVYGGVLVAFVVGVVLLARFLWKDIFSRR